MILFVYFSLLTLSGVIIQVQAISFFNNLSVPNDTFSKIFFDKIKQKNFSYSRIDLEDSEMCMLGLQEIINRYPSLDVFQFIDAWGNIPSGLLYGHMQDLGNFDECLGISTNLSESIGVTNGKYCFASLPLSEDQTDEKAKRRGFEEKIQITIGICVPDVCSAEVLNKIFQDTLKGELYGPLKRVTIDNCIVAESPSFDIINIVGIVIFSTVGLMMLFSTLYDIYVDQFDKPVTELFLAFSVIKNSRKLFEISNSKSVNTIECLRGIRVLSMVWVIYCHCYTLSPKLPFINTIDYIPWSKAASTMHILLATVSVDTFFFISGLLLAWIGFRELDRSDGKLNISMMYFHRYIRLTPSIIAVMFYIVSIDKYVGTGPLGGTLKKYYGNCQDYWWSTLLYIQNYVNPLEICVSQTWYLAVDTQLYCLSPLILIPLWKWGRKFIPIMFLLSLLQIGYVITVYFQQGFQTFMGVQEDDQIRLTYMPTHARYSVWLFGIGFGYFMHRIRSKSIHVSKAIQLFGWGVCFVLIATIIYGPYSAIHTEEIITVLEAALYESLRRVAWGVVISWVVFACHFGFGGLINSFLSHEIWQPLSRLSYAMYLVHINVQIVNYGMTKSDYYFSDYSLILVFWGTFGITLLVATLLTLAFEAPILVIEKFLFTTSKKQLEQNTKTTPKAHLEVIQKLP